MNDNFENERPATNDFGTANDAATGNGGMVTALFRDRASAEKAYDALRERGYTENDINVLMSEEGRTRHFSDGDAANTALGSKAAEGTGIGSAVGGTIGAIVAAVAAIGTSIALPGLGLVIAGPIAAALMGAGAGGITGGLVGALIGSGIPEAHAAEYETGIKEGGIVLGVKSRTAEDAAYIESQFRNAGGESVHR